MSIPYSTGITLSLIPKASVDKIPILSMAYGLSASAKGDVFPWIFNPPAPIGTARRDPRVSSGGGLSTSSRARRSGCLYFDARYGREPIPFFQTLAKTSASIRSSIPSRPPTCRTSRPIGSTSVATGRICSYVGWGAMNPTAVKEAVKEGFPMDKFVSIWWTNEPTSPRGATGQGLQVWLSHHQAANFPAIHRHPETRRGHGPEQGARRQVGRELYNRGVYNGMMIAEGIRTAQKVTGKKVVNAEDVRRGLERSHLDAARLKALGMEGFAAPFKLTCADHNGHSATSFHQWDGAKWVKVSDHHARDGHGRAAHRRSRQGLRGEERVAGAASRATTSREQDSSPSSQGECEAFVPGASAAFSRDREKGKALARPPERGWGEGSPRWPPPPPAPILDVPNIEVIYNSASFSLKGVSLGVPKGGIVALLGANGAGKTTTLKAISNLLRAERGEVTKGAIHLRGRTGRPVRPTNSCGAAPSR